MAAAKKLLPKTPAERRALYGKIQIAKKELGLDEDTYRAMLNTQAGKASLTDLSMKELAGVVEHLKDKGFKPKPARRSGAKKLADSAGAKKIRALWLSLYHLNIVKDPSESALIAFSKRVTGGKSDGVPALQWMDFRQESMVIEALKKWATRGAKVDWSLGDPRESIIAAQKRILLGRGCSQELIIAMKYHDDDQQIAEFGEWIRGLSNG